MLTQFIRCYVHPTNNTIDHVYCNDQGRQPEFEPLSIDGTLYNIIDLTVWTREYIRPSDIKQHLQYNNGIVTFSQRPIKALQDLNQVVDERAQPERTVEPVREREGVT